MITGDYKLGCQYRDLIIEQIKKELKPSEEDIQLMKDRLNKASSDELERTYEAFERFGVEVIMDNICRRNLVFIWKIEGDIMDKNNKTTCRYCECFKCLHKDECFECYSCRNNTNFTDEVKTKCIDRKVEK